MADKDLCWISATEASRLFRTRELSPVELLQSLLDRIEETEPKVNAFTDVYAEQAMAAARLAEARFAQTTESSDVLDGIPTVVKSNTDSAIEGTISGNGTLWMRQPDRHTSPSIERLIDAGAIILGRTTMPEFGWAWTCDTRAYGITRNPWSLGFTSGGSSSGSAVAVATGMTTIGCATDALGSLRHPSAMSGIVGFKPPYGRNPLDPTVSFDFFKHIGPMTRTVADCALMQNVMSGPHALDHATIPGKLTIPESLQDIRGLKVAYSLDLGYFPVTEDVRRETVATLAALRAAGAETTEVSVGWAEQVMRSAARYTDRMYGDLFQSAVRDHPDEICDYTRYYAKDADEVSAAEFHEAQQIAAWAWHDHFGLLFERYDLFVCPTLAFHHVPADNRPWECNVVVDGTSYTDHDGVMTGLFNMYSRCPVIVVPSGFTADGLPTSVQLAGRPFDDVTPFRAAAALEQLRPWLDVPERRPGFLPAGPGRERAEMPV